MGQHLTLEQDFAGSWLKTGQGTHQIGLPVALDTRHADDLSPADFKTDVLELAPAERPNFEIDIRRRIIVLRRKGRFKRAADDHREQVLVAHVFDRRAAHDASVAQNGHPIGNLPQFRQPVGDVDDRCPLGDKLPNFLEKHVGRILIERRGRLIKNENLRFQRQGLGQLEEMLLGDGQGVGPGLNRNMQADRIQQTPRDLMGTCSFENRGWQGNLEIFQDRKVGQNRRVLVGNSDTKGSGDLR